jgi:hypothetical protein
VEGMLRSVTSGPAKSAQLLPPTFLDLVVWNVSPFLYLSPASVVSFLLRRMKRMKKVSLRHHGCSVSM